jgi:hypothetical protein
MDRGASPEVITPTHNSSAYKTSTLSSEETVLIIPSTELVSAGYITGAGPLYCNSAILMIKNESSRGLSVLDHIRVCKASGCKILSPRETPFRGLQRGLYQLLLNAGISCAGLADSVSGGKSGGSPHCATHRGPVSCGLKIFGAPWGCIPVYMCVFPHVVL